MDVANNIFGPGGTDIQRRLRPTNWSGRQLKLYLGGILHANVLDEYGQMLGFPALQIHLVTIDQ